MPFESPISVLYDSNGSEIAVSQSQVVSGVAQPGLMMAGSGSDGKAYFFRVSNDGAIFITGSIQSTPAATQSVWVADWAAAVTGSMKLAAWGTDVTGTVNLVPSQSLIIGAYALLATASVREIGAATTVVSSTISSLTNFTLMSANPARKKATFFKEGTGIAYIKLGATATATSYTVQLSGNGYYETPEAYTGRIDVIFSTAVATSIIRSTEITTP